MKRLALLLLIGCSTPTKPLPDANQAEEQAKLAGYLDGYSEAEKAAMLAKLKHPDVYMVNDTVVYRAPKPPKPAEPVKWEDPDLQVVCWRAPEGISCLPSHTVKAKPRWK
jgi:hypothetical protein